MSHERQIKPSFSSSLRKSTTNVLPLHTQAKASKRLVIHPSAATATHNVGGGQSGAAPTVSTPQPPASGGVGAPPLTKMKSFGVDRKPRARRGGGAGPRRQTNKRAPVSMRAPTHMPTHQTHHIVTAHLNEKAAREAAKAVNVVTATPVTTQPYERSIDHTQL